jgi:hypothetical protein
VRDVARERILLAVAIVSPLAFTLHALTVPRADAGMRFSEDRWAKPAEKVADWFEANDRPGDRIYAFCAAGALYGNLSVPAPFPYVWLADVRDVPGAVDDLVTMLGSPERPRFVAVFQEPAECDESGRAEQALRSNYDEVTTVEGIAVFERNA